MNNSPLDEHIKKQLGNYVPDVPPHIWENIVAGKDRRKPVGFWFNSMNKTTLVVLLGIILFGTAVIIYKNSSSPSSTENKNIASSGLKEENKPAGKISAEATPIIKKEITGDNTIPETGKVQHANTATPSTNDVRKEKDKLNNSTDKAANLKPGINSQGNKSNKNKPSIAVNVTGSDVQASANATSNRSKHFKGRSRIGIKNAIATEDLDEENNNASTTDISNSNDLLLNRLLLNLDLLKAEKNLTASVKKPTVPYLNIPCPESEKNAAGNKRYFEIYGGPDYAFRSISDTGNSAYMQKRKESSTFSSAFSIGVRYTKVFNNGMSFRTGINYSQINEKFKFAEGNIIQVVYITNAAGDTTGSYTTSGTRYKTTYNKFRTIDVPLLIGYELGNGRWHVNFNAGAMVNVYSWQKGDVLDTAYKPVSITTGKAASSSFQFKTNVGVGFLGSVSVYYKLTSRLHILAEPYFRYNFTAANKAELTLKEKYNTAGLRLGVRIDF